MPIHQSRLLRRVSGLGAVTLIACLLPLAIAAPVSASDQATQDEVHRALGIDDIPADYVVLVDVSASMHGARYTALRSALRTFLSAVAPQDQVSLVTFAAGTKVVYSGKAGRVPDAIIRKLPADARGQATDIGKSLETAVDLLARDGAPSIATVVLLTDGRHEPAAGSPYPYESGRSWDDLRRRAAGLTKDALRPIAIPLGGVTGAPLLGKVFADAVILSTTKIDAISRALDQPKRLVQAAKTRSLLAQEGSGAVELRWPSDVGRLSRGETTFTVELASTSRHVPIDVTDLTITSSNPSIMVRMSDTAVTVPPGGRAVVTVTATWNPPADDWLPFARVTTTANLTMAGTVSTPWRDALASDGVTLAPALTNAAVDASGSAPSGHPTLWGVGLASLLTMVLLMGFMIRRRLNPSLYGGLRVDSGFTPLAGRSMSISSATLGIPGQGSIRLRRARLFSGQPCAEITYSRDATAAHREVATCGLGESVQVSGKEFHWTPR